MKDMIKDALILFVITLVAGLCLGYVYNITKEPIALADQLAREKAYKEVFSDASSFENIVEAADVNDISGWNENGFENVTIDTVLSAKDNAGNVLGNVILVSTNEGYGGNISFSIGITNEGIINGISILDISETAGLGMRADEVLKPQFANKKADSFVVTKTGALADNEIDAISGATITSKAVTKAVNAGTYYFNNVLEVNE